MHHLTQGYVNINQAGCNGHKFKGDYSLRGIGRRGIWWYTWTEVILRIRMDLGLHEVLMANYIPCTVALPLLSKVPCIIFRYHVWPCSCFLAKDSRDIVEWRCRYLKHVLLDVPSVPPLLCDLYSYDVGLFNSVGEEHNTTRNKFCERGKAQCAWIINHHQYKRIAWEDWSGNLIIINSTTSNRCECNQNKII